MSIKVVFTLGGDKFREATAEPGQTLLQVARMAGIDLEGACGGSLACATCHVVVDAAWYGKLPAPKEEELAMLELAPGRTRTSRLGCQIVLTEALDGLKIHPPK